MKPLTPEPRTGCKSIVFAENQPPWAALPANFDGNAVETKWRLSWRERFRILISGHLYLSVLTFGHPLQPIRMSVLRDAEPDDLLEGA